MGSRNWRRALAVGASLMAFVTAAEAAETVKMWSWRPQEAELWKQVGEKLGITVELETFKPTDYNTKLQVALNGGTGPDFIQGRNGAAWLEPYVQAGAFVDLTDVVDGSHFPQLALNLVTGSDGKLYGVPFAFQTSHFIYNKELFDQHGLTEPTTWDEFWAVLDKLKAAGVNPLYTPGREAWALNVLSGILDASVLQDEGAKALQTGEACFTGDAYVSNLERMDRMQAYFQSGFEGNDVNDMQTAFALGQTAIIPFGIFSLSPIRQVNPDIQVGLFLAPAAEAGKESKVYAWPDGGYYVNAASPHRETALKLAQFAATPEFGQMFAELVGEIPAVKGDYAKAQEANPVLAEATQMLNERSLGYMTWVRTPFDGGDPRLYTLLSTGLQEMYADKITPRQLAEQIQAGLNSWYPAFTDGHCK